MKYEVSVTESTLYRLVETDARPDPKTEVGYGSGISHIRPLPKDLVARYRRAEARLGALHSEISARLSEWDDAHLEKVLR